MIELTFDATVTARLVVTGRWMLDVGCWMFPGLMAFGYSPGRFRILPNSLSLGSISIRVVGLVPDTWECEPSFVSVLDGLDAIGKAWGLSLIHI